MFVSYYKRAQSSGVSNVNNNASELNVDIALGNGAPGLSPSYSKHFSKKIRLIKNVYIVSQYCHHTRT